jgi:hypothetical protein
MKARRVPVLAILFALLTGAPARAFVPQMVSVDDQLLNPRWPAARLPLSFAVHQGSFELFASLTSGSNPLQPIQAALEAWSIAPVRLTYGGTVAASDYGQDGVNLITVADTPRNRELVGDTWTRAFTFWEAQGDRAWITEADIALHPDGKYATDEDVERGDLQGILTHGLGLALGLGYSPIAAATMSPGLFRGQTYRRELEPDDRAGLRALYGGIEPGTGAITGRVLTLDNEPVFGAHVVATDARGIVRVAVLTDWDGFFTLPSLPAAGSPYQVYAEPVDGPVTPDDLGRVYRDVRFDFRTTFAGSNRLPAAVSVEAGKTTALEPIRVVTRKAALNPLWVLWVGNSFDRIVWQAVQIEPGRDALLAVVGEGLSGVPRSGLRVSGSDVRIDPNTFVRGVLDEVLPYIIVRLSVLPGAVPGARSLYVATADERATLAGCIEVVGR